MSSENMFLRYGSYSSSFFLKNVLYCKLGQFFSFLIMMYIMICINNELTS